MSDFFTSEPVSCISKTRIDENVILEPLRPSSASTSPLIYENLRTYSSNILDNINITANSKFLAYLDSTGSGSSVGVLPLGSYGKNHVPVSSPAYQQPIIRAHSQAVQEISFNPFNDNQLFTVSTDKLLKLWNLPSDGLVVDLSVSDMSMSCASKCALRGVVPHRLASNIVAGRGSREFSIFNTLSGQEVVSSGESHFLGDIHSLSWSFDGSLIVSTSKDKFLRLFDPRLPSTSMNVAKVSSHTGIRYSTTHWLGNSPFLVTYGHNSSTAEREMFVWDSRLMSESSSLPLHKVIIDKTSSNLLTTYDNDSNVILLTDKSGNEMRLCEMDLSSDSKNILRVLVSHNSPELIRGATFLPKQCCELGAGEVYRILKQVDSAIHPLSANVSRCRDFDPTVDVHSYTGAAPALSAEEWFRSTGGLTPNTVTLKPKAPLVTSAAASTEKAETGEEDNEAQKSGSSVSFAVAEDSSRRGSSRIASSRIASGLGSLLKYRHMNAVDNTKDLTYYNITPDLSALDNPIISCNESFWAIPYRGGGGPVYVSRHDSYGKVLPECYTLNAHKAPVQDISFSPFHEGIMATGSIDAKIKLWNVEDTFASGVPTAAAEPIASLDFHRNSIRTCSFHPTVAGLLCSSSQDMTIRFFDINAVNEVSAFNVASVANESALISNISFNYDGTLLSFACKDRLVRILDPRSGKIVATTPNESPLGRNLRVTWCARSLFQDPLVTASAGPSGIRQLNLWDMRNFSEPMISRSLDNASGQLFPMFDEGLNTVFVAGKGDTIIRSFEILSLADTASATGAVVPTSSEQLVDCKLGPHLFEKSYEYQSGRDPIAGVCLMPKRLCDVRKIEVARILKLTSDSVVPIGFKVPRADHLKEYFHDDIFLPIRSKQSDTTVYDWTSIDTPKDRFAPSLESLKPDDMQNVSERAPEPTPSTNNSKVHSFRRVIEQKKEEDKERDDALLKIQRRVEQNAQFNRNLSGPVKIGGVIVSHPQSNDDDSDENDWDS